VSDIPTIKLKEPPELLGPCPRCNEGTVTDIDLDMVHCFNCGEYFYELEEPKLDYWMVGILEECAKTEIKRASSSFPASYVKAQLEGRNEFGVLGQLQLILDRLNEIKTHYDNEIKVGLG